jgi:hypothetical protein
MPRPNYQALPLFDYMFNVTDVGEFPIDMMRDKAPCESFLKSPLTSPETHFLLQVSSEWDDSSVRMFSQPVKRICSGGYNCLWWKEVYAKVDERTSDAMKSEYQMTTFVEYLNSFNMICV